MNGALTVIPDGQTHWPPAVFPSQWHDTLPMMHFHDAERSHAPMTWGTLSVTVARVMAQVLVLLPPHAPAVHMVPSTQVVSH